ncbi:LysR family transcriptional regulator [Pseudomonas fluorescens]|uniref:LysR family transcriptional regulator n=1 Tax=Pseudomonas fluorescens TaxID=294 RepID=UPI000731F12A|nr:LysR substrate-binding domain-containing protein [Pseudomonas fluorescens]
MTLDQLRAFVAVVEHGSIRSAARDLGLAQSGLTQQIKRLESAVNVELFIRGNSGITLSAPGEAFLPRARLILRECDYAQLEAKSSGQDVFGALAVGASSEAFSEILLPVLGQFREQYKRVSVHIASGPSNVLLSRVREAKLDFAITLVATTADMSDLTQTPLDLARPAVICRAGHPLVKCTSLSQLREAEWISTGPYARQGSPSNRLYDLFDAEGYDRPNVILTVESLFDSLSLLLESDLLFLAPSFVLDTAGYSRFLAQIPIREAIPNTNLSLVQRSDVPLPPQARALSSMAVSFASMRRRIHRNKPA